MYVITKSEFERVEELYRIYNLWSASQPLKEKDYCRTSVMQDCLRQIKTIYNGGFVFKSKLIDLLTGEVLCTEPEFLPNKWKNNIREKKWVVRGADNKMVYDEARKIWKIYDPYQGNELRGLGVLEVHEIIIGLEKFKFSFDNNDTYSFMVRTEATDADNMIFETTVKPADQRTHYR